MNRTHLLALGLCLLTACFSKADDDDEDDGDGGGGSSTLTAEEFALQAAKEACSLYEECDLLEFFGDDYETCVSTLEEALLEYVTDPSCDYDPTVAVDCLESYETASCTGDSRDTADSACDDICGPGGSTTDSSDSSRDT